MVYFQLNISNDSSLGDNGVEDSLILITDEVMLPFGEIKISFKGSDGNHNGIKNVIHKLGTEKFIR